MDSDKDPKIKIGGNVSNSNIVNGDNNQIITQAAPREFKDIGTFLPMARNALFTGREIALTTLVEAFHSNSNVIITQAITGMGGIGKSQLALEFAYLAVSAGDFISAHWLNFIDPLQLNAEIAACGRQMGLLEDTAKQPDMVAETLRVWASRGPRLLVLDNYESASDALKTLAPLLNLPTVRLLITARRADFSPELGLCVYPLEVFTPSDSLEFLRKLTKLGDEYSNELQTLAESLGHLPLALHLAGHYLYVEGITPTEYVAELDEILSHESMQAEWFREMEIASPTAHEQSLLGTFALSWQKVTDQIAQTVFKLASYLAPNEPIPLMVFAVVLEVDEKDRNLRRALRQLVDKVGLFTSKDGLPVIHPLLAAYGRYLDGKPSELLERVAEKLAIVTRKLVEDGLPASFIFLREHIFASAQHIQHAGSEKAGTLWNNYGYYLSTIADYVGAYIAYKHAMDIFEVLLGGDHHYVATAANNIGMALRNQGNLIEAQAAFEHALQLNQKANRLEVAHNINNLGLIAEAFGDFNSARNAYESAIQIFELNLGENDPNLAVPINNLGSVLIALGDLHGARTAFTRSIQILETNFTNGHPNLGTCYINLGAVLQSLGEPNQACVCFKCALMIFEQLLPAEHPNIENARGWLSSCDDLPE